MSVMPVRPLRLLFACAAIAAALPVPGYAYTVVARAQGLEVDCGTSGTDVPTDWYFPQPNDNLGLVWVQHGFSRANNHFEELSRRLAEQGYVVFATSLAPGSTGCAMNNAGFLSDFSRLFPDRHDPNVGLLKSAKAAALAGGITLNDLPDEFAFTGHSAGAGSITWVTRKLIENHPAAAAKLAGLVLLDPVEGAGTSLIADATPHISSAGIPALTISSPGYSCNSSANGTTAFVNAIGRPFAGVRLTSGSHCDAEASSSDFLCTGFCGSPQAENVSILQTLDKTWIADFFNDTVTPTYYPGGAYYQSKIGNGRIVTLPQSDCGNGVVNAGEQCDDGNRFAGDCCSGYCQFEAAGSSCAGDGNPCTDDVCTGAGACSHPNNTAPCDDGNACTQTDSCQSGTCGGSNPVECTALDQCHVEGTCDPATGACSNPAKADGSTCDDGNACTQTDSCQGGACGGSNPVECTALDQCHVEGTCDPATGACSNPAKADGSTCDDGNACTQTDSCQSGACSGASPVECTALDQCHVEGTCDPATGACSNPAKADGSTCDDGYACTLEECRSGICLQLGTPCGDGSLDAACGEQCDDGVSNGSNACCSTDCQTVDADADGLCDGDDPCTGPAVMFRSKARVRHLGSDRRDASMTFKARASLPAPFDPPLDILADGLRLVFGVGDRTWTDVTLPGGAFSTASGRGWRVNGRGDLWKYTDRTDAPVAGVTSVAVRDRSAKEPGLIEVAVKAVVPNDPVAPSELPLHVTVVFDLPVAMEGQCAATDFDGVSGICSMGRDNASLQCR